MGLKVDYECKNIERTWTYLKDTVQCAPNARRILHHLGFFCCTCPPPPMYPTVHAYHCRETLAPISRQATTRNANNSTACLKLIEARS